MRGLIPLDRLRQPRARAVELTALTRRARAERAADVEAPERDAAVAVAAAKRAVQDALPAVDACASCARGQPAPVGQHAGGACCAGVTAELFDDDELAALVHAGTRPRDLTPPPRVDPVAGCAFRGATGCALATAHRPARCVHFACGALRAELHRRGALDELEARLAELDAAMRGFRAVHRARRDREVLAPILDAIARHQRRSG